MERSSRHLNCRLVIQSIRFLDIDFLLGVGLLGITSLVVALLCVVSTDSDPVALELHALGLLHVTLLRIEFRGIKLLGIEILVVELLGADGLAKVHVVTLLVTGLLVVLILGVEILLVRHNLGVHSLVNFDNLQIFHHIDLGDTKGETADTNRPRRANNDVSHRKG